MDKAQCEDEALALPALLKRIASMQGLIIRNHLVNEKVTSLKVELADMKTEQDRITRHIEIKTDELYRLMDEAAEIGQCLKGERHDEH